MADTKRAKAPTFTTGRGTASYPKLSTVDFGTKDYPKKDGEYSITLRAQATDPWVGALLSKLEPLHMQAVAAGEVAFKALKAEQRKKLGALKVNPLFTEVLDQDTERPTGEITFKFAMKASGEYQNGKKQGQFWDSRPTIFNADTTVMIKGFRFRDRDSAESITDVHLPMKPEIWGGSVCKVGFEVGVDKEGVPGYFIAGTGVAGLKLGLAAVQVIELVEGGQKDAGSYGFGDEGPQDGEDDGVPEDRSAANGDF